MSKNKLGLKKSIGYFFDFKSSFAVKINLRLIEEIFLGPINIFQVYLTIKREQGNATTLNY